MMKNLYARFLPSIFTLLMTITPSLCQEPVNPDASPEAIRLLEYLYSISGKNILTGQHCAPLIGSTRLSVAHRASGHYPAVFGQDFGFSYPGYWDGINYRQRIVDEAIVRHEKRYPGRAHKAPSLYSFIKTPR